MFSWLLAAGKVCRNVRTSIYDWILYYIDVFSSILHTFLISIDDLENRGIGNSSKMGKNINGWAKVNGY